MKFKNIIGWILALAGFFAFTSLMIASVGVLESIKVYAILVGIVGFIFLTIYLIMAD